MARGVLTTVVSFLQVLQLWLDQEEVSYLIGGENARVKLKDISDDDITGLEIPTGVPLLYTLDAKLRPIADPRAAGLLTGAFLGDPAEIAAAQEKVAAQTKVAA